MHVICQCNNQDKVVTLVILIIYINYKSSKYQCNIHDKADTTILLMHIFIELVNMTKSCMCVHMDLLV